MPNIFCQYNYVYYYVYIIFIYKLPAKLGPNQNSSVTHLWAATHQLRYTVLDHRR